VSGVHFIPFAGYRNRQHALYSRSLQRILIDSHCIQLSGSSNHVDSQPCEDEIPLFEMRLCFVAVPADLSPQSVHRRRRPDLLMTIT